MANGIYDENWLRQVIEEAMQHVLNENKKKEEHRALSAEELKKYGILYFNLKENTAHEIAKALLYAFGKIRQGSETTSDFYCGITNDIVSRKYDHEQKDYAGREIEFVIALQCADMKTAADTDMIMHRQYGFYMGKIETYGNGAVEDSDYVYIYRIPK